MKERQSGNLLLNVSISLLAGAFGCALVLMLAHGSGLIDIFDPKDEGQAKALEAVGSHLSLSVDGGSAPISADAAGVMNMLELQEALQAATEERGQLAAQERPVSVVEARVARPGGTRGLGGQ